MSSYIFTVLQALVTQLVGVFGIFFLFGSMLAILQNRTHRNYSQSVGWKGILWTAWIGTPIHELGHVFFAKLFRHKINTIRIFEPNEKTGGLGHVDHTYRKTSLYQTVGNFFIGGAPMIFGSIVLVLLLYTLVPNGKEIFRPLQIESIGPISIFIALKEMITHLFAPENITAWNFWLFLYISFAISSHIAPSGEDRKAMWHGFGWIVLLLLIANMLTLGVNIHITDFILEINYFLGIFVAIFTYVTIISFLHLFLSFVVLYPFRK